MKVWKRWILKNVYTKATCRQTENQNGNVSIKSLSVRTAWINEYMQNDDEVVTPLLYACGVDNVRLVKILLSHGANPNLMAIDESQCSTMHMAAFYQNVEMMKLLIANGFDGLVSGYPFFF